MKIILKKSKTKILIRIGSLRHGGAEKVLITFLKNIPRNKYEIDLLLNLKSGKYLEEVPDWIDVFYLNKGEMIPTNRPTEIPIKIYRKVYQKIFKIFPSLLYRWILKNKKYDIELIANHELLEEVLKSPIKTSKKVVWVHSDIFNNPNFEKGNLKNFFQTDKILVISEEIKKQFEEIAETKQEKEKIVKIFNPIDSKEIIEKSEYPLQLKEWAPSNIKTFISIGTIYPAKGFDRLIKAHKKLLEEGIENEVLIIGDGYDFQNIKEICKKLKVEQTVKMLGFQTNPYPILKRADYFVLSSRYEGYPTVLFEALALKKPIVATDVSGVREILQEGELGIIVPNSEEGIYQGMKKLIADEIQIKTYIKKMNQKELPFSLENAVISLIEILDSLVIKE